MKLPGVCIACRKPVTWNGRHWINAAKGYRLHRCRASRCGFITRFGDPCVRPAGHGDDYRGWADHRTWYSVQNDRMMRGRKAHNVSDGVSVAPHV